MKIILAVLVLSTYGIAQQPQVELVSAPRPSLRIGDSELQSAPLQSKIVPTQRDKQKVVSKSFIVWTIADGATIAADTLTTVHCLSSPNCVERNPLFGSHPSTLRVAATESAFFATDTLVSYWLKKKGKSWWWVPALVNTAQGGVAAALNLRHH